MNEQCIAWDPLPTAANRYMVVNVAYVEQIALTVPGRPLSLVIASSLEEGPPLDILVLAWRIEFQFVMAFRSSDINLWSGPVPRSEESRRRLEIATWEISNSSWIRSSVSTNHPDHLRPRHFVVASSYTLYDIAAVSWASSELGEWRAVRKTLEERWLNWEHVD